MPKIIDLILSEASVVGTTEYKRVIYALDENGEMWCFIDNQWFHKQIPASESDENPY